MKELRFTDQKVRIEKGELVGYQVDGHEFIHQKRSPGWRSSDTEMFPIIGPTNEADYKVKTPRGLAVQDQHGLLRELSYALISKDSTAAVYRKDYRANTQVVNSKYPKKSTVQKLSWPYDFSFQKHFGLSEKGLGIRFTVEGEEGMPFMLGYHPAFKLYSENPVIEANGETISLQEVMAVGSRALQIADCERIVLRDREKLSITTEGFGNFMLWTEVENMVCIEPITFYPYEVQMSGLHSGFDVLEGKSKEYVTFLSREE